MIITLNLVLLLCALICFVLSAAGVASRINLQSAGLALWVLALLVGAR
jgi:hypothetical protein